MSENVLDFIQLQFYWDWGEAASTTAGENSGTQAGKVAGGGCEHC